MVVEIKLPCGRIMQVKLENGVNLIEYEGKVFMLIDGQIIQDERRLRE